MPAISSVTKPYAGVWSRRLRRELLWTLLLKLVLLFSIKAAFFPHRLTAEDAAQGVIDRMTSQTPPKIETVSKDTP